MANVIIQASFMTPPSPRFRLVGAKVAPSALTPPDHDLSDPSGAARRKTQSRPQIEQSDFGAEAVRRPPSIAKAIDDPLQPLSPLPENASGRRARADETGANYSKMPYLWRRGNGSTHGHGSYGRSIASNRSTLRSSGVSAVRMPRRGSASSGPVRS